MRDIDKYTENYNQPNFEDYQIVYRRKKILEIINRYQPKRILEIGCGMEPLFQYIDWEYDKYIIVEPSRQFFDNAICLAKGNSKVTGYNECFSSTEELKANKVDFIICSSLLHEIEQPMELLQNIVDVCGENTIVHINVPNANSLHRLIAKEMGLIKDIHDMSGRNKLYQQHMVYDLQTLKKSVNLAGFNVLEEGSYFVKPFSHSQMYEMIKKDIISDNVLEGLYRLGKYLPEYGSEIFVNTKIQ